MHADLVGDAKERGLGDWKQFKAFKPLGAGSNSKSVAGTRWVYPWKLVGGEKNAEARLAAEGYENLDLVESSVDMSGRVSFRSSDQQVMSLGALKNRKIHCLDIKNACLQADGFGCDILLRAPVE